MMKSLQYMSIVALFATSCTHAETVKVTNNSGGNIQVAVVQTTKNDAGYHILLRDKKPQKFTTIPAKAGDNVQMIFRPARESGIDRYLIVLAVDQNNHAIGGFAAKSQGANLNDLFTTTNKNWKSLETIADRSKIFGIAKAGNFDANQFTVTKNKDEGIVVKGSLFKI